MIQENEFIDLAHTIMGMHINEDGSKNQIAAMFDFAEEYHNKIISKEAIEFAKWLKKEGWEWSSMFDREEWGNYNAEIPYFKSETELHSIYLATKT